MDTKDDKNLSPEFGAAITANVKTRLILDECSSAVPSSKEKVDHFKKMRETYVDKPKQD